MTSPQTGISAAAAVGQSRLMRAWEEAFGRKDIVVGQAGPWGTGGMASKVRAARQAAGAGIAAIVTKNRGRAARFLREVDAGAVYVNASTRFTDGGEFGPVGLVGLTCEKFVVLGSGQTRDSRRPVK